MLMRDWWQGLPVASWVDRLRELENREDLSSASASAEQSRVTTDWQSHVGSGNTVPLPLLSRIVLPPGRVVLVVAIDRCFVCS